MIKWDKGKRKDNYGTQKVSQGPAAFARGESEIGF